MAAKGCTKGHNRNWPEYNKRLTERGLSIADLAWIPGYDNKLREMNRGKRGCPFEHGTSQIRFIRRLKACMGIPYRMLGGFASSILGASGIAVPGYSTL